MANTTNGIYYPNDYNAAADVLADMKKMAESIDTKFGEVKNNEDETERDISNIKVEQETQNKDISNIKEKNTNQDKLIEELQNQIIELETENENIKNQFPVGQAEGENITLNDSSDMEFKELRIGGNSWQETRSGKNEFNKNDYQLLKAYISNNVITSESNNNIIYIPCLPSTTYAISKKAGMRFGVAYTGVLPEIGGSVEGWISNTTGTSITITTGENASYLVVYVRNGNIAGEITLEEVLNSLQIEKNSVATEYEQFGQMPSPEFSSEIQNVTDSANIVVDNGLEITDANYQAQLFTFPLSEGQRMYKDSYLADDGVHHKRRQVVFNGSEEITLSQLNEDTGIATYRLRIYDYKYVKNLIAMCSHFENLGTTEAMLYTNKEGVGFSFYFNASSASGSSVYVNSKITTLDEFKTWLTSNNITIEYELAEEVIEPYTEEQQLVYNEIKKAHSYKNVTHIFSTDEIKPINKVIYRKDLETLDKNKEDRLLALENAVLGGN